MLVSGKASEIFHEDTCTSSLYAGSLTGMFDAYYYQEVVEFS